VVVLSARSATTAGLYACGPPAVAQPSNTDASRNAVRRGQTMDSSEIVVDPTRMPATATERQTLRVPIATRTEILPQLPNGHHNGRDGVAP